MPCIIVTGCGTGVGKTLASAVLATALNADYWKPVDCGSDDGTTVAAFIGAARVHPPAYCLKAPLSPHHAARLENLRIDALTLPHSICPLVIETAGGPLVPLTLTELTVDRYAPWDADWIVVSRHYVGSINHTLLTLEALKQRHLRLRGLIFNGIPNPDSEEAILRNSNLPLLGRLLPEPHIDTATIERYARQWRL
jgi:dethiobiotin synthetase